MEFRLRKYVPSPIINIAKDDLLCRKIHSTIKSNVTFWFGMFSILAVTLTAFWYVGSSKLVGDEIFHYNQIRSFYGGSLELNPDITNIPTYHIIVAFLARLVGSKQLIAIRLLSMLLGLMALPLFYKIHKTISKAPEKEALLRTFQFYFFPIIFPFFFLVYVDIFSLMWLLAAMLMMTRKKYSWSGIFAIVACLVRQDNIVWLIFIAAYGYFSANNFTFSWKRICDFLKKIWVFVAGVIGFGIFVLANGGVAMGDKVDHQAGFYVDNIYFMLFTVFVLFLPYHVENFPRIVKRLRRRPIFWLLPAAVVGIFLTLQPPLHPFNYTLHFLRDYTLMFIYAKSAYMALYALVVSFAALSLFEFGLVGPALILFPFAILAVMPEWLIEERYYIVAITFFMLFRQKKSLKTEYIALAWQVLIAAIFFVGIAHKWFML